jgi:hypothetical protein
LSDITNKINADSSKNKDKQDKNRPAQKRERGPPADGIASKNKVMVANLPYDLTEEKVSLIPTCSCYKMIVHEIHNANLPRLCSSRSSSQPTSHHLPRLLFAQSPAS